MKRRPVSAGHPSRLGGRMTSFLIFSENDLCSVKKIGYSRRVAETVVICDGLNATGSCYSHIATFSSKVNSNHGHRGHGCW